MILVLDDTPSMLALAAIAESACPERVLRCSALQSNRSRGDTTWSINTTDGFLAQTGPQTFLRCDGILLDVASAECESLCSRLREEQGGFSPIAALAFGRKVQLEYLKKRFRVQALELKLSEILRFLIAPPEPDPAVLEPQALRDCLLSDHPFERLARSYRTVPEIQADDFLTQAASLLDEHQYGILERLLRRFPCVQDALAFIRQGLTPSDA